MKIEYSANNELIAYNDNKRGGEASKTFGHAQNMLARIESRGLGELSGNQNLKGILIAMKDWLVGNIVMDNHEPRKINDSDNGRNVVLLTHETDVFMNFLQGDVEAGALDKDFCNYCRKNNLNLDGIGVKENKVLCDIINYRKSFFSSVDHDKNALKIIVLADKLSPSDENSVRSSGGNSVQPGVFEHKVRKPSEKIVHDFDEDNFENMSPPSTVWRKEIRNFLEQASGGNSVPSGVFNHGVRQPSKIIAHDFENMSPPSTVLRKEIRHLAENRNELKITDNTKGLYDRLMDQSNFDSLSLMKKSFDTLSEFVDIAKDGGYEAAEATLKRGGYSDYADAIRAVLKPGRFEAPDKSIEKLNFLKNFCDPSQTYDVPKLVAHFENDRYAGQLAQNCFGNSGVCSAAVLRFWEALSRGERDNLNEFQNEYDQTFVPLQLEFEEGSVSIEYFPQERRPAKFSDNWLDMDNVKPLIADNVKTGKHESWLNDFVAESGSSGDRLACMQMYPSAGVVNGLKARIMGGAGHAAGLYVSAESKQVFYFNPAFGMYSAPVNDKAVKLLQAIIDKQCAAWGNVALSSSSGNKSLDGDGA
jgi:hypothetical protein